MINSDNISSQEALATLDALKQTKRMAVESFRPPLWLNMMASGFLGIETYAVALSFSANGDLWRITAYTSALGVLLSMLVWFAILRTQGKRMKLFPASFSGKVFSMITGVVVAVIIVGSFELYSAGYLWVPYVAAPINALFLFYLLYKYPTGEWVAEGRM